MQFKRDAKHRIELNSRRSLNYISDCVFIDCRILGLKHPYRSAKFAQIMSIRGTDDCIFCTIVPFVSYWVAGYVVSIHIIADFRF